MAVSLSKLLSATRLSRKGRWSDAALLVQQALGMAPAAKPRRGVAKKIARARPLLTLVPSLLPAPAPVPPAAPEAKAALPRARKAPGARAASFTSHTFAFAGERHTYRLFVPRVDAAAAGKPMPLLLMLHGCKQDAADFARGTAMNALAQEHGCLVLYPEQRTKANGMRCWNWFEPGHQLRGAGEPAMLAALVQKVATRLQADTSRIYVGGLSAGAAMAATLAALYPEMFAAAGLHSGLPAGAARNVVSAFRVMRSGAAASSVPIGPAVPTVVFHGTADKTVNPDNGENLVSAAAAGFKASGKPLKAETLVLKDGARAVTRTTFRDSDGKPQVEQWTVDGGAHAWFGGNAEGSYTDPQGPAASEAMLAFWLQHHK